MACRNLFSSMGIVWWQAISCLATQKFPNVLLNPKAHYRDYKSPPVVPIPSHINPSHTTHNIYLRSILILCTHPPICWSSCRYVFCKHTGGSDEAGVPFSPNEHFASYTPHQFTEIPSCCWDPRKEVNSSVYHFWTLLKKYNFLSVFFYTHTFIFASFWQKIEWNCKPRSRISPPAGREICPVAINSLVRSS
jgi:hypothetical protein